MTKIGLIARADNTGLGTQTWEFARHMKPYKTMIVDMSAISPKELTLYPERYENCAVEHAPLHISKFDEFLEDLDVVYVAESPYHNAFYQYARSVGVKTIAHVNWEMFDPNDYVNGNLPDIFALPTEWHYDDFPFPNKIHLPVPIAIDRWPSRKDHSSSPKFLHIVGHPAVHDRNGTADLLAAWEFVKSDVTLSIYWQGPQDISPPGVSVPRGVEFIWADRENYWEVYERYDILVLPRRYGGLCLPMNEALGAGLPVIMPDVSPNQERLPKDWLVPCHKFNQYQARSKVDLYRCNARDLAAKIDELAINHEPWRAEEIALRNDWDTLKPLYDKVLAV